MVTNFCELDKNNSFFNTPELQDYFNKQPSCRPIYSPKAFPPKLLSKLEQQNLEYISKYQDRYGLRYFQK
ncbi:YARHG domain-containing protein [Nostoc sp.]|uniref:YARHG domain-containing protein n=1 Tax=Nostoc sp. TaxID=1180 RepID=UPI003FA60362